MFASLSFLFRLKSYIRCRLKLKSWGRPTKDEQADNLDVIRFNRGAAGATYPLAGLQRDFENGELKENFAQQYVDGKFRSVRQAALAAGIIRNPTRLDHCVRSGKRSLGDYNIGNGFPSG